MDEIYEVVKMSAGLDVTSVGFYGSGHINYDFLLSPEGYPLPAEGQMYQDPKYIQIPVSKEFHNANQLEALPVGLANCIVKAYHAFDESKFLATWAEEIKIQYMTIVNPKKLYTPPKPKPKPLPVAPTTTWKPQTGFSSSKVTRSLKNAIPDIQKEVKCPACDRVSTVMSTCIHLNDNHRWKREAIADWTETLDLDLQFRPVEEQKKDPKVEPESQWTKNWTQEIYQEIWESLKKHMDNALFTKAQAYEALGLFQTNKTNDTNMKPIVKGHTSDFILLDDGKIELYNKVGKTYTVSGSIKDGTFTVEEDK